MALPNSSTSTMTSYSDHHTDFCILIPVFNHHQDLYKSLYSIKSSAFRFKIVIVDDGSTPLITLPDNLNQKDVILLRLNSNMGITHALNAGIALIQREVKPKYIARLDAGDICHPDRFDKQIRQLEQNTDLFLIGAFANVVDSKTNKFLYQWAPPAQFNIIQKKIHQNTCFIHPTIIFRSTLLDHIGFYRDRFPAAEDYDFVFRALLKFRCENYPEALINYQYNPEGISLSRRKEQLMSRLKIQIAYFSLRYLDSYIGVFKTLVLLSLPHSIIQWIKQLKKKSF